MTISDYTESLGVARGEVEDSLFRIPAMPLTEESERYTFQDTEGGMDIQYEGQENEKKNGIKVSLPKNYTEPIEVKLDEERVVTIQDNTKESYRATLFSQDVMQKEESAQWKNLFNFGQNTESKSFLQYQNNRKSLIYAYQKDAATGERKLKHWTIYNRGIGEEKESYSINGATIKKTESGEVAVYYQSEQDFKNEAVKAEVDQGLLERAQRTLEQEIGVDRTRAPDILIPKPYYLTKNGERKDLEWTVNEDKREISLIFKESFDQYPIALDPTLQFTVGRGSNEGGVVKKTGALAAGDINADGKTDLIVGNATDNNVYIFYNDAVYDSLGYMDVTISGAASDNLGTSVSTGDMNADGKIDLIAGAPTASCAGVGSVYIFYNDGEYPASASSANVTITGEVGSTCLGTALSVGDFNADGTVDLAASTSRYSTNTGRVYIFHNDGSIPTTAATADVTITGNATSDFFGDALTSGDLNGDGETDLIVGAYGYNPGGAADTGRTYIFHNDGSIPTTAATADVTITGAAASDKFGKSLVTGDLNADSKTDLAIGAIGHSTSTGRTYIFHNDGSIPTTAGTADVTLTGEATSDLFGTALTVGDFNTDGRIDLAVGAPGRNTATGRAYIFYNDGSMPTAAGTADVGMSGNVTNGNFGNALMSGDMNVDSRTDLIVSQSSSTGSTYLFYSQNGVVHTNISLTGETTSNHFGFAMAAGDFNTDGRGDLAIGAYGYSTSTGRVYIFYSDGSLPSLASSADVTITGEATGDLFGATLASGDFNADGRVDFIAGASGYLTDQGRAYIFYNDGSIPTTAATADVIITGNASSDFFGGNNASVNTAIVPGDFNSDGRMDVAIGAYGHSSVTGRVYIFHNDGSIPTTAATADVTITGNAGSDRFGIAITSGDLNADGRTDLAVGAENYSSATGRAYIFYNDGSIPTTAATADVTLDGVSGDSAAFGRMLAVADMNLDGEVDLLAGANTSTTAGSVYIFYNDGSYPAGATTADHTIVGQAVNDFFGRFFTVGDYNGDGRTDLAVGASTKNSSAGRAYIFYNDGSLPTTAGTADVLIDADAASDAYGRSMLSGDFDGDNKTDLAIAARGHSTNTGRVHIYRSQKNFAWELQEQPLGSPRIQPNVTGEEIKITGSGTSATASNFSVALEAGDFNSDGEADLAVGAEIYDIGGSPYGAVYIFYSDGNYPAGSSSADIIITGSTTSGRFGKALKKGDFNSDGRIDLAVGAYDIDTAYIFHNDGSIPTTAATADVTITGDADSDFGISLESGDLNADGETDLAVGAYAYSTNTGRVYIFHNDGSIPTTAGTADVTITGNATGDYFGTALAAGDFNFDGEVDLAIGALGYSSSTGRAYIFHNDGSIPTTAATADVTITGNATGDNFGIALAAGDLNADATVDLVIGAYAYSSNTGRAYIFHNDGSIPTTAATADVTITGNATSDNFGRALTVGDLNNDSKVDLVVGAHGYSSSTGRAYIFYNDGSIPTTAATADVTITGETASDNFGYALVTSDFNADGKTDLVSGAYGYSGQRGRVYIYTMNDAVVSGGATSDNFGITLVVGDFNIDGQIDLMVGANGYSSSTGRVYIFYHGSSATTPSSADVTITGEATDNYFGEAITVGDFNADGEVDFAVGASGYSTDTGRAYIFYNDGSIPTTAATADVTISGETDSAFGNALTAGDLNADGETDLVVSAYGYASFGYTGRTYIFHNDGSIPTTAATADVTITGNATSDTFGKTLTVGDLNADGEVDLVVGAMGYDTSSGRAYIFYNDGSIPTTAATADVTITGNAGSGDRFSESLATADMNFDGETDLIVGAGLADNTGTATGKVYIFHNDGSIPTTAATADVTISGTTSYDSFGTALSVGDLNADGRTDLTVGATGYTSSTGRAYTFYNDGSIPTTAATADVVLTGNTTGDYFGGSFAIGDFNNDSLKDLAIGASGYSSNTGRVYTIISEAAPVTPEAANLKGSFDLKGSFELK